MYKHLTTIFSPKTSLLALAAITLLTEMRHQLSPYHHDIEFAQQQNMPMLIVCQDYVPLDTISATKIDDSACLFNIHLQQISTLPVHRSEVITLRNIKGFTLIQSPELRYTKDG